LRDFLFPPERLHAPVSMLSGGERNRLLLARLFARPSNLLVMDEPTNDLDADTLELLEEMVANYAGTLLLVSHDRAFLDNVVTSTLVFEGEAHVNEYVGGYSDWLHQRKVGGAGQARVKAAVPAQAASNASSAGRPAVAKTRRLSYKDQRELEAMPDKIQRLEAEQLQLQTAIADPSLFQGNSPRGGDALLRLQALTAELENAYSRWDTLESES
jgi:ABC transport system ATP-binding/permease protein